MHPPEFSEKIRYELLFDDDEVPITRIAEGYTESFAPNRNAPSWFAKIKWINTHW
jgi:hypothetical protein